MSLTGTHMKTKEHRKRISKQNTKHGDGKCNSQNAKLYHMWNNMKSRCFNSHSTRYVSYGGKGIQVCEDWQNNYSVFKKWALKSGYKIGLTIHRLDKAGDYNPDNCVFITRKEHGHLHPPPPRPQKINDIQIQKMFCLFTKQNITPKQLSSLFSIPRNTVYNILNGKGCLRYKRLYKEYHEHI